jgi:two-component system LytT family sensor kinase
MAPLKQLSKILSNLAFWHISFWVISFVLFTSSFFVPFFREGKVEWDYLKIGLIYGFYLLAVVYVNYLILIPKYVAQKKIAKYIFLVVFIAIAFGFLFALTFYLFIGANVATLTAVSFFVLEIVFIIITSFFKFFKDWISNIGLKVTLLEIEKQKVEAELDALKSQLNPHFLFNVLNIIYSHSLLKSELTPSIVIKLSDLMSYILYDCKTKTVPIQKEIDFLNNYIDLEKIRMEEDIDITLEVTSEEQINLPPLLFFPLLENAF